MERLTEKVFVVPAGQWKVLNDEEYKKYKYVVDRPKYADLYSRLGMIENLLCGDKREYSIDRLRELIEADREGRCLVSPCKVGDRLYTIRTIQDGSFTLEIYDAGEIRQISVNTNGTFFLVDYGYSLSANNFGKTVFKTREAAESDLKAMKEREDDDRA